MKLIIYYDNLLITYSWRQNVTKSCVCTFSQGKSAHYILPQNMKINENIRTSPLLGFSQVLASAKNTVWSLPSCVTFSLWTRQMLQSMETKY